MPASGQAGAAQQDTRLDASMALGDVVCGSHWFRADETV